MSGGSPISRHGAGVADVATVTAHAQLTPEDAGRLAVVAVAADPEYWARTASTCGHVGLNDLTRALDVVRGARRARMLRASPELSGP
jgi:hypothetical protein